MTEIVQYQQPAAPAGRRGKPVYFADGFYSMHSDKELEQFGMASPLPPSFRLYLLAVSRINRWGHAPFRPGELVRLLGVSKPTFRSAMRSLQRAKMVSPDSTALCVALSSQAIRRADRSNRRCAEPRHLDVQELMWVHGYGWEKRPDQWQNILNDPGQREHYASEIQYSRTITETVTIRSR
jgi:hypothetical protein